MDVVPYEGVAVGVGSWETPCLVAIGVPRASPRPVVLVVLVSAMFGHTVLPAAVEAGARSPSMLIIPAAIAASTIAALGMMVLIDHRPRNNGRTVS